MKALILILALAQALAGARASASAAELLVKPRAAPAPAAPSLAQLRSVVAGLAAPAPLTTPALPIQDQARADPAVVDKLAGLVKAGTSWQATAALYTLASSKSPRAWQTVDAYFRKNPDSPHAGLLVYRRFLADPKKAFAFWAEAASRGPPEPPAWWVESAGFFDHPDFAAALEDCLRRADWSPRWKVPAAGLAARLGSGYAARALYELSWNNDPDVSLPAVETIGEALGPLSKADPEVQRRLELELRRLLHAGSPRQRAAAAKGLSHLQERLEGEDRQRAQSALAETWTSLGSADPRRRLSQVRALGRIGTEAVVPMLESVLRSEHFELRERAARARHHIWARRDAEDPQAAKTAEISAEQTVMVPAYIDGSDAYWHGDMARLDWALRHRVIEAVGPAVIPVPRKEGRVIVGEEQRHYGGDQILAREFQALGYETDGLFMVPMRHPKHHASYSKIHGRSFHAERDGKAAVFKNVGGLKLETSGNWSILFDPEGHGGGMTPGFAAFVSRRLDDAFADTRNNPAVALARRYGAGPDIAMRHIARFQPAGIPAWDSKTDSVKVLGADELDKRFPGVKISPVFLYETPVARRTEEFGSMRDSLYAAVNWLPLLSRRPSAAELLLEVAARKALLSYIFHQQWGLAAGWPDPANGNQVLSTHNKNPLTHFDFDTVYQPDILEPVYGDQSRARIESHIVREIGWLAAELRLIGDDLLLSARQTAAATALFYHVLLADHLAGVDKPTTPPILEKKQRIAMP